jgi:hypothetical protein
MLEDLGVVQLDVDVNGSLECVVWEKLRNHQGERVNPDFGGYMEL